MSKVKLREKEFDLSVRAEREEYWHLYATTNLMGKEIKIAFLLDEESVENMGWSQTPNMCLEFTDGSVIYPSHDDEGNGPGHFSLRSKHNITDLSGGYISSVRYLNQAEVDKLGFNRRGLMIKVVFKNGTDCILVAQSDPEGNDAGAVFGSSAKGEEWTFPVLS